MHDIQSHSQLILLHLAIEINWILNNLFYLNEDYVKQFLVIEPDNCMYSDDQPIYSVIFIMFDRMLRSSQNWLKEMTLNVILQAICDSIRIGKLIFDGT